MEKGLNINNSIQETKKAKFKKDRYLGGNIHSFVLQEQQLFDSSESTRMKLGFKSGFDFNETNIGLAELDALYLICKHVEQVYLYSKMANFGLNSKLIQHFSYCEKTGSPYFFPDSEEEKGYGKVEIFKRVEYRQSHKNSLGENETFLSHQYRLNGGMKLFYIINQIDPYFFKNIYMAVKQGICSVSRLDICCDYGNENLMSLVSQNVKLGRCHAYQAQLHGIGALNDEPFSKKIGPNTELHKVGLKHQNSFVLDSLYAGSSRYTSCVVYFYNKSKEQRKRRQILCENKTRIEVRFFNKEYDPKYEKVITWLLYSLSIPDQDEKGQFIRHLVFTCALFSHISFETAKQTSRPSMLLDFKKRGVWVEWFQDLYEIFVHACITPWPRSKLSIQHSEFSDLISNFKKDPDATLEALLGLNAEDFSSFCHNQEKKD